MKQITDTIMMIQPAAFRYNEETAVNNYYQRSGNSLTVKQIQKRALIEFTNFVKELRDRGVNVIVFEDTSCPETPDAIFPNNWISTHVDGSIFLYPMFAKNRRTERRLDIVEYLQRHFIVKNIYNTHFYESKNLFLEGTGSMVLDRKNKIAYASISERTNKQLFEQWCDKMRFTPISFFSHQFIRNKKELIYHTNVIISVADKYAVLCLDAIGDKKERRLVVDALERKGKEIIEISEKQKCGFAANVLQLMGNEKYLVMSQSAFDVLSGSQKYQIEKHNSIIHSRLDTIETYGGGSARCMMAEIFLSKQK